MPVDLRRAAPITRGGAALHSAADASSSSSQTQAVRFMALDSAAAAARPPRAALYGSFQLPPTSGSCGRRRRQGAAAFWGCLAASSSPIRGERAGAGAQCAQRRQTRPGEAGGAGRGGARMPDGAFLPSELPAQLAARAHLGVRRRDAGADPLCTLVRRGVRARSGLKSQQRANCVEQPGTSGGYLPMAAGLARRHGGLGAACTTERGDAPLRILTT